MTTSAGLGETASIDAEWRFEGSPSDIPAVGWSEDAKSLDLVVNLCAAHQRLILPEAFNP